MITLDALTKRYGDVTAVDGLSVQIRPGRVTGFLGPNGAGKSTTMRMVLGLDAPTSGRALVDGVPYAALERPLRRVGALLDARAVHPGRRARTHLLGTARSNGIPAARVDEVLDLVGLAAVARRRAGGFSLGMAQRLGIATALLGDPPVLLFDEPVNGLDTEGVRWIRGLMRSLAAEGRTVLVSSHLMSELELTADHVVVIGRGRLIADAPIGEVIAGSSLAAVLVRSPDAEGLAALARRLGVEGGSTEPGGGGLLVSGVPVERIGEAAHALGVVLHELSPRAATLEQAFVELTEGSTEYAGGAR
jgi:ABC-2 type transport system ATP-binding protein